MGQALIKMPLTQDQIDQINQKKNRYSQNLQKYFGCARKQTNQTKRSKSIDFSSGIKVDPECISAYYSFEMGKSSSFMVMGFNEELTKIVVLHTEIKNKHRGNSIEEKNSHWSELIDMLPDDDVRYFVAEVNFKVDDLPRSDYQDLEVDDLPRSDS